jgi:hypothetical protein
MSKDIVPPPPILKIDFYQRLQEARRVFIQDGISETVGAIDLTTLDSELSKLVPLLASKLLPKVG